MLPIVFLPGLLSDKRIWQHQANSLKNDYAIQIIELFSENTPKGIVDNVLAKAPQQFVMVGHSMGGWIALEVTKVAPERVKHLCLINTTARLDSENKKNSRLNMLDQVKNGKFEKVVDTLTEAMVFNRDVYPDVKNMMQEVGEKVFMSQEQAMLIREDCRPFLPQISCPTLVIHSNEDKIFTLADHLELANQIPLAKLAIIDDCGHMTPLERPQALTTLLRFWVQNF